MKYENKKAVIVGAGIAGKGAFFLAEKEGLHPEYYVNESSLNGCDLVVVSPGFPLTHEIFSLCAKRHIPIIGEIEFGYRYCNKPIIAVTGTNGKTTTVKLIKDIFCAAGKKACECGNIGNSFCQLVADNDYEIAILEVSSFQLQTIVNFAPDIAVILNIGEDHLDRHKTRKDYALSKLNIAKNMNINNSLVLNGNIEIGLLNEFEPKCRVFFTGLECDYGVYCRDDKIFFNSEMICLTKDIGMKGEHNLQNAMAAICVAKLNKISNKTIESVLKEFTPPSHRIEFVDRINGISFYNDSKGTNIDATLAAVKSLTGNICLILGGSDKGENFDRLFIGLGVRVKKVIAMGAIKDIIARSAVKYGFSDIELCEGLEQAVTLGYNSGCNTVLLSPAAASFDRYNGYAQRGEHFVSLVKELKK